jgi:hypothetical protein
MTILGAVSAAWTAAEAALPLGWRLAGVVRRERALRLLPVVSDAPRPEWCALAEDEVGTLYDGWGQFHYQALMNLALKLREIREPTTG